jgi:predicted AAA+ superfamily ATPase
MKLEELLILLNEWWKTGRVDEDRVKPYRRKCFSDLKDLMKYRQIIVISGLRRVGKSTLMFQLIDDLLRSGVEPRKILYFSFDEKVEDLTDILNVFQKIVKTDWRRENIYVFLDEIQKLEGWSSKIKILYDNFPKIKFIVSGSASIQLASEAVSDLAGRYFLEEVKPLSLEEYYELRSGRRIDNYELYRNDIALELDDYFKKPYPEIVNWREERRIFEYIRESILAKILRIDLPDTFKNVNPKLLWSLLEIFYREPGMILNLDSLSRSLRIHKKTLEWHIFLLQFAKLIVLVKNFRVSALAESRKLRKVYPYDISLVFPFNPNIEEGKVAECAVASKINAQNYWREGNREVDFLIRNGKIIPVEVKYRKILDRSDTRNLTYFLKKFKIDFGVIIYNGETREITPQIKAINLLDFIYLPTSKLITHQAS